MAAILCIETATTNCSVALSDSGSVIAFKEDYNKQYSHGERLHTYIQEVLEAAKYTWDQIDAIAISEGPGSYTGLRIGVSAAKGFCYAKNLPLIAIPTLESLARQVNIDAGFIVPMLDARRMEAYAVVLDTNYKILQEVAPTILEASSFSDYLDESPVYFIGNSNAKFKAICEHANAQFMADTLPSACDMAILAEQRFKANNFEDLAYFEPRYLKAFKIG